MLSVALADNRISSMIFKKALALEVFSQGHGLEVFSQGYAVLKYFHRHFLYLRSRVSDPLAEGDFVSNQG